MADLIYAYGAYAVGPVLTTIEQTLLSSTGWPLWAVRTIEILFAILGVVTLLQTQTQGDGDDQKVADSVPQKRGSRGGKRQVVDTEHDQSHFRSFQLNYLAVYLIVMLADWLQGPNMYTLYTSYGVDVGTLFITGFLSSAIFGTFLGVYVDSWGRKFGCVVFCVLEIIINLLEHVPNFTTLMVGRIMGGISTSLLFSAFESWMVSEHRKRGFSEEKLTGTFSLCSSWNGIMAILAGFIAQISCDIGGDIGPFQVAIVLTIKALVLLSFWEENYGEQDENKRAKAIKGGPMASILTSIKEAASTCTNSTPILCLGLSQAIFEGGVYTFVFLWVKVLAMFLPGGKVPTGLVMTCFMLAMTIGGSTSALMQPMYLGGAKGLSVLIYAAAAIAMAVPTIFFSFGPVFISMLVLEAMVGMFNACGATLRSKYYPEAQQSAMMSVFRIPLNALVVLGTHLSDEANDVDSIKRVFMVMMAMHTIAMALQMCLNVASKEKGA